VRGKQNVLCSKQNIFSRAARAGLGADDNCRSGTVKQPVFARNFALFEHLFY
jgi:hypothetical protein